MNCHGEPRATKRMLLKKSPTNQLQIMDALMLRSVEDLALVMHEHEPQACDTLALVILPGLWHSEHGFNSEGKRS